MASVADRLEKEIAALGTEERAVGSKRYLKSDLHFHGTSLPDTRRVVKSFLKETPDFDRVNALALVEALWSKPVFERKLAAVIILEERTDLLQARDVSLLERLLRASKTWALVDPIATKIVGSLVERYASLGATLDRWACDGDFWIRRSALLALLVPLRRGGGDFDRFSRYADDMLEEKEFFIRKAIGWVLRETSKIKPDLVCEWLEPRAHRASGVTMREATKYLSSTQTRKLKAARN